LTDRFDEDNTDIDMIVDTKIDEAIRKIPDFPKPGILFFDLTSILTNHDVFAHVVDKMVEMYRDVPIDAVAAIEARGFLFASPFAYRRGVPLILLRKKGKLPGKTISREFDLEYGTDTIEVHTDDVVPGSRVLVIDDLIATGGTVSAACSLIDDAGANVCGVFSVVALPFLDFSSRLPGREIRYLQEYVTEKL